MFRCAIREVPVISMDDNLDSCSKKFRTRVQAMHAPQWCVSGQKKRFMTELFEHLLKSVHGLVGRHGRPD